MAEDEAPKGKKISKEDEKLLTRVKQRFHDMSEADHENRQRAMEDLKFAKVPGEQWDDNMKQERGKRPCFEFNKLNISIKRIVNDMRANRPQGKVRPVEGGDREIADIHEGLLRNIWTVSDADTAIDYAADFQVTAGMGAWRVKTEYVDEESFDQDIKICPIQNPFTLYADEGSKEPLYRDARDWCLTEKIGRQSFKDKYPEAQYADFTSGDHEFDDEEWFDDDSVRVCEYWWKEKKTVQIVLVGFQDGSTSLVRSDSPDYEEVLAGAEAGTMQILRDKTVEVDQIMSVIVSGAEVLREKQEFPGRNFPFIMVHGERQWIDGRPYWWGLTRFARDAQQSYNVSRTAIAETIAQAPKSFIWATAEQAKGNMKLWLRAHKENMPFQIYNNDPTAPGPPQRIGGPDVPVALIQQSQMDSEDLKAVTGIFDASLSARSNETSGRAILARQTQGEIVNFNFADNQAKGVQRTYEIILGMIPYIYDTERELRVLGVDGVEKYKTINQVDPETGERINDLSMGKYDVTVDIGPNFKTMRQEAGEIYAQLSQQFPELMAVAGDLIMQSMDFPYADEIAERLKTLLPPQVQTMLQAQAQNKEMPKEVAEALQLVEQKAQQLQQMEQQLMQASQEIQEREYKARDEENRAQVASKDVEIQIARLRAEQAELKQDIAERLSQMSEGDDAGPGIEALQKAVASIDATLASVIESLATVQPQTAADDGTGQPRASSGIPSR